MVWHHRVIEAESGEEQVYLAPVPPTGQEWQVSVTGAIGGLFSPEADAIYLLDNHLLTRQPGLGVERVSFSTDPDVELGVPEPLFRIEDEIVRYLSEHFGCTFP